MNLQIKARFKAWLHGLRYGFTKGHKIWRLYSHFGFKIYWIGCECGKDFTDKPLNIAIEDIYAK